MAERLVANVLGTKGGKRPGGLCSQHSVCIQTISPRVGHQTYPLNCTRHSHSLETFRLYFLQRINVWSITWLEEEQLFPSRKGKIRLPFFLPFVKIYLWPRCAFTVCSRAVSSCGQWRAALSSPWAGFRLRRRLLRGHMVFSSCGSWTPEPWLGSCGAQASLPHSMWDLPVPGMEPVSPALAGGFPSTGPARKPQTGLIFSFLSASFRGSWRCYFHVFWRSCRVNGVGFQLMFWDSGFLDLSQYQWSILLSASKILMLQSVFSILLYLCCYLGRRVK